MAVPIMIQGTMSSAGKSLIAAALCRIFFQDGFSVAPFKSQNMALNSFVTLRGDEMGRAQVMQAEACCKEPDVLMNPVLLKPSGDCTSQVIVNGKVLCNMRAKDYFDYKKNLWPHILDSYNKLSRENDIIVIEGAGSPAEINLKQNDIVNMGLARELDSPVLLVGDIDRGGVFAQIIGTIILLEEEERKLIKGTVINKFRGDKSLLDSGIKILEEKTRIPVAGTIPFVHLNLDDEDSVTERFNSKKIIPMEDCVKISVIRLPHISNFSDFSIFEEYGTVYLNYCMNPEDLIDSDIVIIPGTKNTIEDMLWLREKGFSGIMHRLAGKGVLIFGICGGFQILGKSISDPYGVESDEGSVAEGLGLLPVKTVLTRNKIRTRVKGYIKNVEGEYSFLGGKKIEGYEIHVGETFSACCGDIDSDFFTELDDQNNLHKKEGCTFAACGKNIFGTYVHGFFDSVELATSLVNHFAEKKGLEKIYLSKSIKEIKNEQYNLLADVVRSNINMDYVYSMLRK